MESNRRKFLKIVSHALGGTLAAGVIAPLIGLIIHPWLKETVYGTEDFIKIGNLDNFPVGVPQKMTITSSKRDAWNAFKGLVMGSVWAVRQKDDSFKVFSTNCPHLGCGINWSEDKNKFLCPCHEGVFDIHGQKISGPAPRGLYSYKTKVENNKVMVGYKNIT